MARGRARRRSRAAGHRLPRRRPMLAPRGAPAALFRAGGLTHPGRRVQTGVQCGWARVAAWPARSCPWSGDAIGGGASPEEVFGQATPDATAIVYLGDCYPEGRPEEW